MSRSATGPRRIYQGHRIDEDQFKKKLVDLLLGTGAGAILVIIQLMYRNPTECRPMGLRHRSTFDKAKNKHYFSI